MQDFVRTTLMTEGVVASAYPSSDEELAALVALDVSQLINLHERPHAPERLAAHGLTEVHIPVVDFTPPTPVQLQAAITAIEAARSEGRTVAVHCAAGLGRTGTVIASYLTRSGLPAADAIERVRTLRPGSVETQEQVDAVVAFASAE